MRKSISEYEYRQAQNYIYDAYSMWGENLNKEECIASCWIAYLEGKKVYQYIIGSEEYWEGISLRLKECLVKIRHTRNERIKLESNMSLNHRYEDGKEEIITMLPGKFGDFVNGIALWDYSKNLGEIKYAILKLMYAGEEDTDIINILRLSEHEYYLYKTELRRDFQKYINL